MTSTKKLFTTTAAAAAIATGALAATTVHADADTPEGNSQATSQAPATSQATAQDKLANAQAALQSQQASQAAAMPQQLADKQAELTQQAQPRVDSENASYQQAVASQQAANSQAVANASQNITTPLQKQTLTAQENQLYSQKTQKLDAEHQQHLDGLKSAYDAQASQLNSQIQSQQTNEQQAHDQAIKDANAMGGGGGGVAQTSVDNLQTAVNNDQAEVTNAQNAVNQAQSQVDSATKALNDAKGDSQTSSQGNLPDAEMDDNGVGQFDIWKDTDPADQRKATFDANGQLTGQDAIEINEFAANVLNELRKSMGAPLLKVNANSIKVASDSTKNYQLEHSGWGAGHDNNILNRMQDKYGIPFLGESAIDGGHSGTTTTIADLKDQVYRELIEFINQDGDSNDTHRDHLLGVNGFAPYTYFGMNFTSGGTRYYTMSFNNPADATGNFSLATNPSSTPVDNTAALTSALNSAKSALSSANSRLTSAKAKLTKDTDSLNAAKIALATLKGTARPGDTSTDADSPAVKDLKGKMAALTSTYQANVKKENDAYNQAKAKLTKDHQARLDQIKNKPENVDDVKAQNQKALDTLKKNHEAKLAAIKADTAKQLEAYKQQLIAENAKKNQPLVDEINALKAEINKPAESGHVSDVVNGDKDSYVTKDGKVVTIGHANAGSANTPVATVGTPSASASTTTPVFSSSSASTTNTPSATFKSSGAQPVYPTRESVRKAAEQLPQTGNNNSIALIALGAVASMLGLGLAKKREY